MSKPDGRIVPIPMKHRPEPLMGRLGVFAIAEAEAAAGQGLGKMFSEGAGIGTYLYVLWAALLHRPPVEPWTVEVAAREMDRHIDAGGTIPDLARSVNELVIRAGLVPRSLIEGDKPEPDPGEGTPADEGAPAAGVADPTPAPTSAAG